MSENTDSDLTDWEKLDNVAKNLHGIQQYLRGVQATLTEDDLLSVALREVGTMVLCCREDLDNILYPIDERDPSDVPSQGN